jgi:hypothetical protein
VIFAVVALFHSYAQKPRTETEEKACSSERAKEADRRSHSKSRRWQRRHAKSSPHQK